MNPVNQDTIVALATAQGTAAIAVIRLSGPRAIGLAEGLFYTKTLKKRSLAGKASHTAHFGLIVHNGAVIDEVLLTLFRAPGTYTGQDVVEISCHGSRFIQQQILQLLLDAGARMAAPGEFTLRAFLNGKLDLSQAEAVADLIASNSPVSHKVAMQQMRGGFSNAIKALRENLIHFAALIELELDFSEEDVEFADRSDLRNLVQRIIDAIARLLASFELGNVIRNGVPVAIVGRPNAGKSTLLNVLLEDERAIVSDIPGTTRDTIEDELVIDGVLFRFIDTAGIRTTTDLIEQIGVNKAFETMRRSAIIIYLLDAHELSAADLRRELDIVSSHTGSSQLLVVANKIDTEDLGELRDEFADYPAMLYISAKDQLYIGDLKQRLLDMFHERTPAAGETIVTNARHAASLRRAAQALQQVVAGLDQRIAGDLLALDIRFALDELGAITGEVTNEDLLDNIFTKFCIGK